MKFLIKKRWLGITVGLVEIDLPDVRVKVSVEAELDPDQAKEEGPAK